jgi:hypothetical protein
MKKFGEIGDNKGFRLRGHIFTECCARVASIAAFSAVDELSFCYSRIGARGAGRARPFG